MKRPWGSRRWLSSATRMMIHPWRKILTKRNWVARRDWAGGPSPSPRDNRVLSGSVSSAIPPTLSSHNVATATANHSRAARCGSVMRVRCHCHPPRFVILKPCSIQALNPYQHASPAPFRGRVFTQPEAAHEFLSVCDLAPLVATALARSRHAGAAGD